MELILLIVIAALAVISIVLSLAKGNNHAQVEQLQAALRQQMQENREELNHSIRELRMEMTQTLNQNMQQDVYKRQNLIWKQDVRIRFVYICRI